MDNISKVLVLVAVLILVIFVAVMSNEYPLATLIGLAGLAVVFWAIGKLIYRKNEN